MRLDVYACVNGWNQGMEDKDVECTPGSSGSRPTARRDGEEVSAVSSFKGSEMRIPASARSKHRLIADSVLKRGACLCEAYIRYTFSVYLCIYTDEKILRGLLLSNSETVQRIPKFRSP